MYVHEASEEINRQTDTDGHSHIDRNVAGDFGGHAELRALVIIAVAAVALLLVVSTVFATLWWTDPITLQSAPQGIATKTTLSLTPASDAEARRIADALRGRDGMSQVHESLLRILAERREELPAQTVAALEENLLIIDHAIAEIHRAMENSADSQKNRCRPMNAPLNTTRTQNASPPAALATSEKPITHHGSLRPATT